MATAQDAPDDALDAMTDAPGDASQEGDATEVGETETDGTPATGCQVGDCDEDGIADDDEVLIAQRYAPLLAFHSDEQHATRYTWWAVRPTAGGVSVLYAIGYFRELWFDEATATERLTNGDPEFLVVELTGDVDDTALSRVYLSRRHDHPPAGSGWLPGVFFTLDTADGGVHPIVYVSLDGHSNWEAVSECNLPNLRTQPLCRSDGPRELVEVDAERNLGSLVRPVDAVEVERDGVTYTEHFVTYERFCGWQVADGGDRTQCSTVSYNDIMGTWLANQL